MSIPKIVPLIDIEVDALTNSIQNAISGDSFETEVLPVEQSDLVRVKKKDWDFDWKKEAKTTDRQVYKLTIVGNPKVIQGLLSIEDLKDHMFVHLIESAMFNRGKDKLYLGVAGNLFGYACKISFEKNYDGYVSFFAKTALIEHYKKLLGAVPIGSLKMIIETRAAYKLVNQYYPTFFSK